MAWSGCAFQVSSDCVLWLFSVSLLIATSEVAAALRTPSIFEGQAIVTPQPNEHADPLKLSQLPGFTEDDAMPAFNPLFQGSSSDTSSAGTTKCWIDLSMIIDALLPFIHWYVGRF